jgi:hypothetical protein
MSADYSPWNNLFQRCGKVTWASEKSENLEFDVFEYRGKKIIFPIAQLVNYILNSRIKSLFWKRIIRRLPDVEWDPKSDILRCDSPETWDRLLTKTLSAVKFALNHKRYDYIVRINSTTYVNLDKLVEVLKCNPDYAGCMSGKKFATGWAIILSRESAATLVNPNHFPLRVGLRNDDDAIGYLLGLNQISLTALRCSTMKDVPRTRVEIDTIKKCVFVRVKNIQNREELDPLYFKKIHQIVRENQTS